MSGIGELNPFLYLGKVAYYRCTNPARNNVIISDLSSCLVRVEKETLKENETISVKAVRFEGSSELILAESLPVF